MQKIGKYLAVLIVICLSLSLGACSSSSSDTPKSSKPAEPSAAGSSQNPSSAPAKTVKIKLSTSWGEKSSVQEAALKFKELLSKASNGRFEVTVYPSNQLSSGNQQAAIEMVQNGDIEMAMASNTLLSYLNDKLAVVNMPFLFSSYEDVDKIFLNGEGRKALEPIIVKSGLIPMSYGEAGFRQITNSKREVHTPGDMKGLKFRILSTCPMFFDLYGALGANPTSMNMSEVFTGLQQGVIDGQENAVDTARSYKLNEVQKHITLWNGVYDGIPFVASPKFMDKLSAEDKAMINDCAKQAMEFQRQTNRANEKLILDEFSKTMKITTLTAEETKAFKEAVKPVYDKWYDKVGADVMAAFGYKK